MIFSDLGLKTYSLLMEYKLMKKEKHKITNVPVNMDYINSTTERGKKDRFRGTTT